MPIGVLETTLILGIFVFSGIYLMGNNCEMDIFENDSINDDIGIYSTLIDDESDNEIYDNIDDNTDDYTDYE
jgi:hypothetical protein